MATATLTVEPDSTKMGQYLQTLNRRLLKSRHRSFAFDERITLSGQGWFFDKQPVLSVDPVGTCHATGTMPHFMAYAVNEYGGIDNLLRFMEIKADFALSLS